MIETPQPIMQQPTKIKIFNSWTRDLLLLTLLLTILFGTLLGSRHLSVPDEARYAEIPREMVATGDYLTPHLNYLKYFQKPPLFYWLQAGAIKTLGLSEWVVRLPNTLIALLGCLFTYITARQYYGRRCGWLASIILASSALYFVMARYITLDMTLSVLLAGCLFSFMLGVREPPSWRRTAYFWSLYIFAALAVLTKGLVGMVLPGLIVFTWLCLTNRWRELKTYHLPSGVLIFLLIALPWHIAVQLKNPEFFDYYFIDQHFRRYLTDYAGRQQPLWYLPLFFLGGFLPWTGFLPPTIYYHVRQWWRQRQQHADTLFLILWTGLIYLFFQLSHSQLPPYILPIFTPCAILLARYLTNAWQQPPQQGIRWGLFITFLLALGSMIGAFCLPLVIKAPVPTWLWITASILSAGLASVLLLALKTYRRRGLPKAFILLTAATTVFLAFSLNVLYPPLDLKTIKPLALQIKALYQPGDQIVAYHGYYQDLPFYTKQRIIIVNWQGEELAFGMQHQNTKGWVLDDAAFWRLWRSPQRVFVILSQRDFAQLQAIQLPPFYRLGQTARVVLLVNQQPPKD